MQLQFTLLDSPKCLRCAAVLIQREKEAPCRFAKRRFCSIECYRAYGTEKNYVSEDSKRCSRCEGVKSVAEFGKGKGRDGLRSRCKQCDVGVTLEWNRRNPDIHRKESREYYHRKKSDADFVEKKRKQAGDSAKRHPEAGRRSAKKWREQHPEKAKAVYQRFYEQNPEKIREYARKRRARKVQAEGSFTIEEWLSLCEKHKNKCLCCGRDDLALTQDHVIPLVKGGTDDISNIQPLCSRCNSRKRTEIIDYRPDR